MCQDNTKKHKCCGGCKKGFKAASEKPAPSPAAPAACTPADGAKKGCGCKGKKPRA